MKQPQITGVCPTCGHNHSDTEGTRVAVMNTITNTLNEWEKAGKVSGLTLDDVQALSQSVIESL